jgi:hypothetical protein
MTAEQVLALAALLADLYRNLAAVQADLEVARKRIAELEAANG